MKKDFHRVKQPTPTELTDSCLQILRSRFYNQPGDDKCFAQDRSRLLAWVVLWPATWLNKKGVTLHGDQYRQIFGRLPNPPPAAPTTAALGRLLLGDWVVPFETLSLVLLAALVGAVLLGGAPETGDS